MEEKEIVLENIENWEEDFLEDKPQTGSKYFSDAVPEGALSFKAEITFKTNGEKKVNNFKNEVINFVIEVSGQEKYWEVSTKQWELLKAISQAKKATGSLIGKKAVLERTGSGRTDTRRQITFIGGQ